MPVTDESPEVVSVTPGAGFDDLETEPTLTPRKVKARKPVFRVRRLTETGDDPAVGPKYDTLAQARRYVVLNHPRGREVYVEHPDGHQEHYSADLALQGEESGGWTELSEDEVE
jgi:hypothetical protein